MIQLGNIWQVWSATGTETPPKISTHLLGALNHHLICLFKLKDSLTALILVAVKHRRHLLLHLLSQQQGVLSLILITLRWKTVQSCRGKTKKINESLISPASNSCDSAQVRRTRKGSVYRSLLHPLNHLRPFSLSLKRTHTHTPSDASTEQQIFRRQVAVTSNQNHWPTPQGIPDSLPCSSRLWQTFADCGISDEKSMH